MSNEPSFLEILREPISAIESALTLSLQRANPERALLESSDYAFDAAAYARATFLEQRVRGDLHLQEERTWDGAAGTWQDQVVWLDGRWEGHELSVVAVCYPTLVRERRRQWVLGPSRAVLERFFTEVCRWCTEVRDEVLVFANGCWNKSRPLREAIRSTTFDDLVLPDELKSTLRADFASFFASEAAYARYGVPWKRGVLLLGPPGNGKTHCIKALVNELSVPCLYVQSFVAPHTPPQVQIAEVFTRARRAAPCLLVLEDLDSLIDDSSRAFFLNELDGFAANRGVVTVATTNHPDRLDPAILDRPSRFDRKYHFELPAAAERARYLALWNAKLDAELRMSDDALTSLTAATEGFSYAYLKELFLSSMMAWMSTREPMEALIERQVGLLRGQMSSVLDLRAQLVPEDPHALPPSWRRHR